MRNNFVVAFLVLQGYLSVKGDGFQFELEKSRDWQYPGRCVDMALHMTLVSNTPIKMKIKCPVNNSAAILKIKETKLHSSTCGKYSGSSKPILSSSTNNPSIYDEAILDFGNVLVSSTCSMIVGVKFQLLDYPGFLHGQSVWPSIGAEYINQSIFAAQQAVRTMQIAVPQPVLYVTVSSAEFDVMDGGFPMVLGVIAYHDCTKTSANAERARIIIEPPSNIQYQSFKENTGSVVVSFAQSGTKLIFEAGPMNFTQEINFNLTLQLDTSQPKTDRELQWVTLYVDVSANGSSPICTTPNKEFSETSSTTTTSQIYRPFSTCDSAIGLAGSSVADSAFFASSYSIGNEPFMARLNGAGAWKPSTALRKDRKQYLQYNSTSRLQIRRLSTQGLCDVYGNGTDAFVKAFMLYYSQNGAIWNAVEEGSNVKVFSANKNCKKATIIPLPFDVEAKFLRIVPVEFENEIALKLEVYGCTSIFPVPAVTYIPNRSLIPRNNDIFVCNIGMARKTSEPSCHYSSDGMSWKALHFSILHVSHYDPTTGHLYAVAGRDGQIKLRSGQDIEKAWDVVSNDDFMSKKAATGAVLAVSADGLALTDDASTLSPHASHKFPVNGASITWGWSGFGVHSSTDSGITWISRVIWSCKDLAA